MGNLNKGHLIQLNEQQEARLQAVLVNGKGIKAVLIKGLEVAEKEKGAAK